ncbi:hypothetical protein INT44_009351 [Umbelopsis vinacea]|uniref:Cyclin N-terminal domain-containing protein n=1 Tax=Umbelopsis vinacea TaxID=44442 RepID=A0A8H7Q457_9FUNG|nr:hypothetical protein INT44_009351 [Umbelopsis vinacea]
MYTFGFKKRQPKIGCVATTEYTQPLSVEVLDGKTPRLHVDISRTAKPDIYSPVVDSGYASSTAQSTHFTAALPAIQEDNNNTIIDALPRISEVLTSVIPKGDIPAVMEVLTQAFKYEKTTMSIEENTTANEGHPEDEHQTPTQSTLRKPMSKSMTAPNLKRYTKVSTTREGGEGAKTSNKGRGYKKSGSKLKSLVTDWLFGSRSTMRPVSKADKDMAVIADISRSPGKLVKSYTIPRDINRDFEDIQVTPVGQGSSMIALETKIELRQLNLSSEKVQKRHTVQITSNLERKSSLAVRTRQAVTLVKSKSLRRTRSCASKINPSRNINQQQDIAESTLASPNSSLKPAGIKTLTRAKTVIGVSQYAIKRQPLKQRKSSDRSQESSNDDTESSLDTVTESSETISSPAMSLSDIQSPHKPHPKVVRKPVSISDDISSNAIITSSQSASSSSSSQIDDDFGMAQPMSMSDFLKREEVFSFPDVHFSDSSEDESSSLTNEDLMEQTIKPGMVKSSKTESQIASQEAPPYISISASHAAAAVTGGTVSKSSLKSLVKSNSTSSLLTVDATISKGNVDLTVKCVADVIYEIICNNHASLRFSTDSVLLYREASHRGPYGNVPYTKWRQIHEQLAYVFECGELRAECAIITLIYIERMLKSSKIDLYDGNWRLTILGALLLAVKVWDDCAVYNIDFISLFPEIGVRYMNTLERFFIRALNYDVSIKSSLFATEYFKLRGRAMTQKFQQKVSSYSKSSSANQYLGSSEINRIPGLNQDDNGTPDKANFTQPFESCTMLSAKKAGKLEACSSRHGWKQSETFHDLSKLVTTAESSQLLITSATTGPFGGVGGNIFDNIDDFRKCNSDLAFVTLGKAIIN